MLPPHDTNMASGFGSSRIARRQNRHLLTRDRNFDKAISVTPPNFNTDGLSVILVRDLRTALMAWTRGLLERSQARWVMVAGDGAGEACI